MAELGGVWFQEGPPGSGYMITQNPWLALYPPPKEASLVESSTTLRGDMSCVLGGLDRCPFYQQEEMQGFPLPHQGPLIVSCRCCMGVRGTAVSAGVGLTPPSCTPL